MFNEFVYENQFVLEIDNHIKFIKKNKRKKYYARFAHIKSIIKNKYLIYIKYTKKKIICESYSPLQNINMPNIIKKIIVIQQRLKNP
jgi:hypothetical protein